MVAITANSIDLVPSATSELPLLAPSSARPCPHHTFTCLFELYSLHAPLPLPGAFSYCKISPVSSLQTALSSTGGKSTCSVLPAVAGPAPPSCLVLACGRFSQPLQASFSSASHPLPLYDLHTFPFLVLQRATIPP